LTWPDLSTQAWIAIATTVLVGGLGGALTDVSPWYRALRVPSWKPPDWAFGPGWTVILSLACYAAIQGWQALTPGPFRWAVMGVFIANGVLNALWSLLFFKLRRPDWALAEVPLLWLSVVILIVCLAPHAGTAWCLVPYAVWVGFAASLNRAVVRLNRPFGPAGQS
jgi:tryptophan-rich sensory protein